MNGTWLQILRQELVQTYHCLLRSFALRWCNFGPNKNTSPAQQLRNTATNETRSLQ